MIDEKEFLEGFQILRKQWPSAFSESRQTEIKRRYQGLHSGAFLKAAQNLVFEGGTAPSGDVLHATLFRCHNKLRKPPEDPSESLKQLNPKDRELVQAGFSPAMIAAGRIIAKVVMNIDPKPKGLLHVTKRFRLTENDYLEIFDELKSKKPQKWAKYFKNK